MLPELPGRTAGQRQKMGGGIRRSPAPHTAQEGPQQTQGKSRRGGPTDSRTHPVREAKRKKKEKELSDLKGIMNPKGTYILITGSPEEQREKGEAGDSFEEKMAENLLPWGQKQTSRPRKLRVPVR